MRIRTANNKRRAREWRRRQAPARPWLHRSGQLIFFDELERYEWSGAIGRWLDRAWEGPSLEGITFHTWDPGSGQVQVTPIAPEDFYKTEEEAQ